MLQQFVFVVVVVVMVIVRRGSLSLLIGVVDGSSQATLQIHPHGILSTAASHRAPYTLVAARSLRSRSSKTCFLIDSVVLIDACLQRLRSSSKFAKTIQSASAITYQKHALQRKRKRYIQAQSKLNV